MHKLWIMCSCQCVWLTIALDGRRDVLAQALVDVEHVQVNAAQLQDEWVTHGFTRPHVGLQDAA